MSPCKTPHLLYNKFDFKKVSDCRTQKIFSFPYDIFANTTITPKPNKICAKMTLKKLVEMFVAKP